jgi:hypothetical protein
MRTNTVLVRLTDEEHEQLEAWRAERRPLPPKAEAVRHLMQVGYDTAKPQPAKK